MEVRTESVGGWVVTLVRGDIDVATAPRLSEALRAAARESEPRMIVDLGQVSFMDSTGIHTLLEAVQLCASNGGELILARPTGPVRRVLEVAGVSDRFRFIGSPEEVLDRSGRAPGADAVGGEGSA